MDIEAQLIWSKTFKVTVEDGETDDEAIARAVEMAKMDGAGEDTNWDFQDITYDVLEARGDDEVI